MLPESMRFNPAASPPNHRRKRQNKLPLAGSRRLLTRPGWTRTVRGDTPALPQVTHFLAFSSIGDPRTGLFAPHTLVVSSKTPINFAPAQGRITRATLCAH